MTYREAIEMMEKHKLPSNFDQWDLANKGGWRPLSELDFYGGDMRCVWRNQTGYLHG